MQKKKSKEEKAEEAKQQAKDRRNELKRRAAKAGRVPVLTRREAAVARAAVAAYHALAFQPRERLGMVANRAKRNARSLRILRRREAKATA